MSAGPALQADDSRGPSGLAKRKRSFIARNACQACRTKKTKCDQDSPYSQCRLLGIDCIYNESRAFKHETSLSVIMTALERIETKIDAKSAEVDHNSSLPGGRRRSNVQNPNPSAQQPLTSPWETPVSTPLVDNERTKLSFSAHRIIDAALPTAEQERLHRKAHFESERPILQPGKAVGLEDGASWLESLSLSHLKRLCDLYFDTFNRTAPILDRESFPKTVGVAVESGFGSNLESCLVLTVMCLGCLAINAYEEGGFALPDQSKICRPLLADWGTGLSSPQDNGLAMRFFDEGRKRIGFLLSHRDLQSCQYFLLSSTVFGMLLRPLEEWAMTSQACAISATFWQSSPDDHDEYHVDLQRRLFWSALMRETILIDELELPPSPLRSLEGNVSLPKFSRYSDRREDRGGPDEYYHCHYLAQIAVRIIMTRIRDELFYANPSVYLAQELYHQLEQWRSSLHPSIRDEFDSDCITDDQPARHFAVTMLKGRYWISIYHIGRPFLYKVISNTSQSTPSDIEICRRSMEAAVTWFAAFRRCIRMRSYMHLTFFVCGQLFGQLLIAYRLMSAPDELIQSIVPKEIEHWRREALGFMRTVALSNPTVAQDVETVSKLFDSA